MHAYLCPCFKLQVQQSNNVSLWVTLMLQSFFLIFSSCRCSWMQVIGHNLNIYMYICFTMKATTTECPHYISCFVQKSPSSRCSIFSILEEFILNKYCHVRFLFFFFNCEAKRRHIIAFSILCLNLVGSFNNGVGI